MPSSNTAGAKTPRQSPVEPNRGGRPSHLPTGENRRMVEVLAGFGIPAEKIAFVLGIDRKTVDKHYRSEIQRGAAMVEAKLVGNLLRIAGGTDGTALKAIMFSLNCRFGWSQYAPAPLGKKAEADLQAQNAHEESDWNGLVN